MTVCAIYRTSVSSLDTAEATVVPRGHHSVGVGSCLTRPIRRMQAKGVAHILTYDIMVVMASLVQEKACRNGGVRGSGLTADL